MTTRWWPYGLEEHEVTLARLSAELPNGFDPSRCDTAANLRHLVEHGVDGSHTRVLQCVVQLCEKFPTLAPAVALDVATTWEFG